MMTQFEEACIAEIEALSRSMRQQMSESEKRLASLLIERWKDRGLVDMANLIVAMDMWRSNIKVAKLINESSGISCMSEWKCRAEWSENKGN